MPSYLDQGRALHDNEFRLKVHIALHQTAQTIEPEAVGAMTQAKWDKRHYLAGRILTMPLNGDEILDQFVFWVAAQQPVPLSSTDADIFASVNAGFNPLAGVTAADG